MKAVLGSGIINMSLSWMAWNPLMDEPSKPKPSLIMSSLRRDAGNE
jgi:hypothetical protein